MFLGEIGETGLTKMPFTMYLWGGRGYEISQSTNLFLQYLSKFPRADWLLAIVYKSTDNKNDVRCNARAFST